MAPAIARVVALVAMGVAVLCGAGPAAAATLQLPVRELLDLARAEGRRLLQP
jgi:hypothetical protein